MSFDEDAYYDTTLDVPNIRYGKLIAIPGGNGPPGVQGPAGPPGVSNVPGPTGPAGPVGATGPAGPTGATGPAGSGSTVPGPTGPQGVPGEVGQPGVSLDIEGTVPTYADLPANPTEGLAWVVAADGLLYFFDGTAFPADGAGVPFQGPQGVQGIQGVPGASVTGPAGPAGPSAVSADAGNTSKLGTDGKIFTPAGTGSAYTLPPATATVLGGVKQGTGVAIAADGTLSTVPQQAIKKTTGRLFLVLDDVFVSHNQALVEADRRGQKLNLAVCTNWLDSPGVNHMTWNDVTKAGQRGHGLMSHSKTHAWLEDATDENMVMEFDESRKLIEGVTGIRVKDFVYPSSKHDLRTDSAALGRYRRVFAGKWGDSTWKWSWPDYRNKPFVSGRFDWASSNHAAVIAEVKRAAAAGEDIVIYTHATDGSNYMTEGVTAVEFTEVLDLALSLGMELPHIDELDGDANPLVDPSFDDPVNFGANFEITASKATFTAGIVPATPATGLAGSSVLYLNAKGSSSADYLYVTQRLLIPATRFREQKLPAVLGARVKTLGTPAGANRGAFISLLTADQNGVLAPNVKNSTVYTGTDWSAAKVVVTPDYTNYSVYIIVRYWLNGFDGEAWFDHAQLSMGLGDQIA